MNRNRWLPATSLENTNITQVTKEAVNIITKNQTDFFFSSLSPFNHEITVNGQYAGELEIHICSTIDSPMCLCFSYKAIVRIELNRLPIMMIHREKKKQFFFVFLCFIFSTK